MTNELPEEVRKQIKAEATAAYADVHAFIAYTKGATAWAPWKVRYDELRLQLQAQDANVEILLSQKSDLQAQAQRMADALEKIIEMNRQNAADQYGDPEKAETWACVIVAREALQFRDGKKEVGDEG